MNLKTSNKNIFVILLLFILVYFGVNYFFSKKIKFKAFEECIDVVKDETANWITRKDAISYCKNENF